VLVRDRKVVVRGGVGRIDLRGPFPAVNRLPPQATLRHADPELDLLLRIVARVGCNGRRGGRE
jgi:hypothetical protein